jgi:hypothetical protein
MIAAVYGLQVGTKRILRYHALTRAKALVFIIKREFMLIGWMVVYILS